MTSIQLSELGIMNSNAKYDEKIHTTLGGEISWLMIHMQRSSTKEYSLWFEERTEAIRKPKRASQAFPLEYCKKNRKKMAKWLDSAKK